MSTIYYKVFNRDLRCRGFQYKEGETYETLERIVLCKTGFHFCKDLVLTLGYYLTSNITDNKYAEVEILGDTIFEEPHRHKGVTNKIKILKVLTDEEVLSMVDSRRNSGNYNSGNYNSGFYNSGFYNSGNSNSGNSNSGNYNSGNYNSGNRNSGNRNSGYSNSGNKNSGNSNSGNSNSGNSNSGDYNSGNSNSGFYNSGSWNSIDNESGFFNSVNSPMVRIFNHYIERNLWDVAYKPNFLFFPQQKDKTYKESFQEAWNKADPNDRIKVKDLPGFDATVFFDITGIKIT